jgi:hypothetical protein
VIITTAFAVEPARNSRSLHSGHGVSAVNLTVPSFSRRRDNFVRALSPSSTSSSEGELDAGAVRQKKTSPVLYKPPKGSPVWDDGRVVDLNPKCSARLVASSPSPIRSAHADTLMQAYSRVNRRQIWDDGRVVGSSETTYLGSSEAAHLPVCASPSNSPCSSSLSPPSRENMSRPLPPHAIKEFSFSPQSQHQAVVSETPRSTSANSPGPISTRSPSPVSSAATALEKHREGPVAGPTLLDESVRLSQRLSELQGFRRRHSGQVF